MREVAGLSERELARVRGRLVEFSEEMFASMRRKDQRRWGEVGLSPGLRTVVFRLLGPVGW
jgi:hypothetical protein